MSKKIISSLILPFSIFFMAFSSPMRSGHVTGYEAWWFMGGDEEHVQASAVSGGIQNLVDGEDTCPDESWKYNSRLPNSIEQPSLSYITNSFTIEGNHEIEFVFSINAVNEDGTLNYKSKNNLDDVDIYVHNAENDQQLASLRIWYDSGGYTNGNHSYHLGVGDGYPAGKYSGSNWIDGDAQLSSSFLINFSKEHLFRSHINKWYDGKLYRLDNNKNAFYNAAKDLFTDVNNIYFRIRGDGGFAKQATIILRSINGQSMASDESGILDNKAPDIYETSQMPASIERGIEFTIPVKAVDVLSEPTVKYFFDDVELTSNKVTPTELGTHTIKVEATDAKDNKSEKVYDINVTGALMPPTITSLPEINDQTLKTNQLFKCGLPTYEDETATAVVTATLKNKAKSDIINLEYDDEGYFFKEINNTFESGDYEVMYRVTNSVGYVDSDPISFHLEIIQVPEPDFVTYEEGISVSYVDEGLLVHSVGKWIKTSFGVFDIKYGIDVYYTVPINNYDGKENTASYFDMQLVNKENENYWVMYRIWLNEEFLTNDSSPTNMYFNFGTPGNSQCVDVTDCGWLTRTVNGVDGQFHFNYDVNNGFSGEFRGVLQGAQGTGALTARFFDEAPTSNFHVKFYTDSRGEVRGTEPHPNNHHSEFVINEINGQNLSNENGVFNVVARPNVVIGSVNPVYKANSTSYINMYVKDILNLHPTYNVRFMNENGETVKEENFNYSPVPINTPSEGFYKVKIFTINRKGKEIGKTFDVEARSSVDPVSVDIVGEYKSSYLPGDKLTILNATYSSNTDLTKTHISLIKDKEVKEVHVGDEITLEKAGMYIIDYYACDNAFPNPNEIHKKEYINVLDNVKPVVDISITGSLRAKEEVGININIVDDTNCDSAIIVTDTHGYKTTFFGDSASFIPEEKGEYTITVRVEDSYNNITLETTTIVIKKQAANKTLISWIVIASIFGSVLAGFIFLTTYTTYKRKKGEIN